MKTITSIGILSLLLFICMSAAPPKKTTSPSFSFFRTHHQGRGITSTWGLNSNAGVSGFVVKRTYEDPTDPYAEWQPVFTSPCSGSRSYKCTDNNVSAGFVTYKVEVDMTDGSTMDSDISTEHIVSH